MDPSDLEPSVKKKRKKTYQFEDSGRGRGRGREHTLVGQGAASPAQAARRTFLAMYACVARPAVWRDGGAEVPLNREPNRFDHGDERENTLFCHGALHHKLTACSFGRGLS